MADCLCFSINNKWNGLLRCKMFWVDPHTKEKAEKLAERLGTSIPSGIDLVLWALPILEAITDRIERIERKLEKLIEGGEGG